MIVLGKKSEAELYYQVTQWLLGIKGIGRVKTRRIIEQVNDIEKLCLGSFEDLKTYEGQLQISMRELLHHRQLPELQTMYDENMTEASGILTYWDRRYPESLKQVNDPPLRLFYKGNIEIISETKRKIAIVGTRVPTDYGRKYGSEISKILAGAGYVIVSGMAMGIDAVAHKAAIDVAGESIGVLGCGVNLIYPKQNEKIYKEILAQGLLISEYEVNKAPHPIHFPERNRIIAGLSEACVVVEAAKKSGSLITAEMAMDLGRDVYALPGAIHSTKSVGCHELIYSGAQPIISLDNLKEQFGALAIEEKADKLGNSIYQKHPVIQYLSLKGQASFQEIMEALEMDISELMELLDCFEKEKIVKTMGFFYHL
jgi:DNA processing protein